MTFWDFDGWANHRRERLGLIPIKRTIDDLDRNLLRRKDLVQLAALLWLINDDGG